MIHRIDLHRNNLLLRDYGNKFTVGICRYFSESLIVALEVGYMQKKIFWGTYVQ